ncbi:MAG: ATP-grasp domain-containing protein [Coriobacteriia bacterium]|nr:ATP-grasp domain-containing protein [Coriobacteriia bacterium]
MFILEAPYVSDLLARTVAASGLPVLDTPTAREALASAGTPLFDDDAFAAAFASRADARLYSNSENAIGWIAEHLASTALPGRIDVFKDKVCFRRLVADLYPEYGFADLCLADLRSFDPTTLTAPFVIKPAVGFFSMGVHVVESPQDWLETVALIEREVESFARVYPDQVLGLDRFIAEEVIDGEEFAVDAYFDSAGEVTIVNIYGHLFASADDVSDRVYYTSIELIERYREPFAEFLAEVGRRAELTDFPMHAEIRVDAAGNIAPIEINPMRFGGWCATDLAYFAYGINPYTTYMDGISPDWTRIAEECRGKLTALVVADLPSSVELSAIESVDYDAFAANFSRVLEMRPTDFNHYPVFAFTFVEVPADDLSELDVILGADLTSYVTVREA